MLKSLLHAPVLAALTTFSIIAGVWSVDYTLRSDQRATETARLKADAGRAFEIVSDRVAAVLNLLNDTGNVIAQSYQNSETAVAAFDRFVKDGNLLQRHPEMDAVAFMRRVDAAAVDRVASHINSDPARQNSGHGTFVPRPEAATDQRVMVEMVHPIAFSRQMSGFDLMTTSRRDPIERALAQRSSAASGKISLFGDRPGVVVYVPVFAHPDDALPLGFTATGFVTDVFFDNLRDLLEPLNLDLEIYDIGRGTGNEGPVSFAEDNRLATLLISNPELELGAIDVDPRGLSTTIKFADRQWTVFVRPARAVPSPPWMPDFNVLVGALIAFPIGGIVYYIRRDSRHLAAKVEARALDLQDALNELESRRALAQRLALHDDLTSLLNRRGLHNALERQLEEGDVQVLCLNLDGFKAINDSRGHATGDSLLRFVAAKLRHLAPADAFVARTGGDEFVVTIPTDAKFKDHPIIAQLFEWMAKPLCIRGQDIRVSASIGVAHSAVSGTSVESLLTDADIALYRAKAEGKNRHVLCAPSLRAAYDAQHKLGEELRFALENNQIVPYFQTQHNATNHAIVGAEALVRWEHPERGLISPSQFLPVAEGLGVMNEIDTCILEKSVACVRHLEQSGLVLPKINVNVSLARLSDPQLISTARNLPKTRAKLVFEIVEAVYLDDRASIEAWELDKLRDCGIGIELDDFGTGHASVIALMQLMPDRLKLDQGFIRGLPDPSIERLIQSIVEMGKAMGIASTAEGIETEEQAKLLAGMGVDILQGYYFSAPLPFDALKTRLQEAA